MQADPQPIAEPTMSMNGRLVEGVVPSEVIERARDAVVKLARLFRMFVIWVVVWDWTDTPLNVLNFQVSEPGVRREHSTGPRGGGKPWPMGGR